MSEDIFLQLKTKDAEIVHVPARISKLSGLIKTVLDDGSTEEEIPLPFVSRPVLEKIIQFCELRNYEPLPLIPAPVSINLAESVEDPAALEFISSMNLEELTEILIACNYLDLKSLLLLGQARIASYVKGKSIEALSKELGISEKFTPEEEARMMQENPWVMEDREERLALGK